MPSPFIADLHIHSRYSLATSKQCDLPHLWAWAQIKGISVVATGDFTHPQWFKELKSQLTPAEPGLFRLKDSYKSEVRELVPESCKAPVRFLLSSEISSIYKRGGKTRKVHNLLYAPDLAAVSKIRKKLDAIGNINSDGRPILGLDSEKLFRIALDCCDDIVLVPAHIWTPWFSVLGSKSGFDSIEECYGDLADRIFAVETGLSSDPPMNWRLSALDRFALLSNSDAHSPEKLGRNANRFNCDRSFAGIFNALKTRKGFEGTLDMFPELGKYHLDGHRKCSVCFDPSGTKMADGLCPKCGKPVTVGVMNRVDALADRKKPVQPKKAPGFKHLVPLKDAISDTIGKGPNTKAVKTVYDPLIEKIGPELTILLLTPYAQIESVAGKRVALAIQKIREGDLHVNAGYDGQFGTVRIFD
jgi:DNA helicase-2/ATP-dependent DNA helicase PcrA